MGASRTLLRKQTKCSAGGLMLLAQRFPNVKLATFERKIGKKGTPNARFYLIGVNPPVKAGLPAIGRFFNATKGRSFWKPLPQAAA